MKLNQIKFYTDMKTFMESFKAWMNQMTFMQTISLIGKEFVFSTDTVDALKGGDYQILSGEKVEDVVVKIYDGDEVIKEISMDLEKGLNPLDVSDLPKGQFTVKRHAEELF